MLRYLMVFVLIYIVWKIMRILTSSSRHSKYEPPAEPPFSKIEDADFEDITPKQKTAEPTNPKQDR